jgi:transcriptional regulator with XRE-family HTH domain
MASVKRARPVMIDSADALGIAVHLQRTSLKLTQQKVADLGSLERTVVSQLECGGGDTATFRVVLLVVDALGMDIELRPRNWAPTGVALLDPAASVKDLELNRRTLARLQDVGIHEIGQLGGGDELIELPQFSEGHELYQIVGALNRQGLSLPANRRWGRLPGDREREMFHLRVVKGLTSSSP